MKTFMDSVSKVNPAGKKAALVKFLASRPEILSAGISGDSSVYGVFTDGVIMVYSNSRKYDATVPVMPLLPLPAPRGGAAGKTYSTLPGTKDAYLMDVETPQSDQTYIAQSTRALNRLLIVSTTQAGYVPHALNSTIENLKKVNGAALFHIATHGALAEVSGAGADVYSLLTAETRDEVKDGTDYKIDLAEKRLTFFWTDTPPDEKGETGIVCRYGITAAFVKKYMTFSANSLIIISACTSYEPGLMSAFSQAGASVFMGWDNVTDASISDPAAAFIFDRCFGTNLLPPIPDPPQRPFAWELVYWDLDFRGYTVSKLDKGARMRYSQMKGDLLMLVPTIENVLFPARGTDQRLSITGNWGTEPGQVLLNGSPLEIIGPWNERTIETKVPAGGGNIQVVVNGLKSNIVQLTEYSGTVTYTETGKGSLKKRMTMNLNFIVDIHKYRITPGANAVYRDEPLFWFERPIGLLLAGSRVDYESSGKHKRTSTDSTVWSGAGTFGLTPSILSTAPTGGGGGGGFVDDEGKTATLKFMCQAPYTLIESGSGTRVSFFSSTGKFPQPITPTVASGYVLKGGTLTDTDGDITYSLVWSDMTPRYLPDIMAPR